jgi:Tat protein translocase TatB subunit
MFNMTGSEVMFLLIIGLVVLGPEKLPDAIRRMGKLYAELKRMSSGVQTDFRKVMDEPLKEMMSTTNSMKALFTDTASEFQSAAKEIIEPTFIPYDDGSNSAQAQDSEQTDQDEQDDTDIAEGIANAARIAEQRKEDTSKHSEVNRLEYNVDDQDVISDEPKLDQPTTKKLVAKKPAKILAKTPAKKSKKISVTKKPVTKKPVTKKPVTKKLVTKKPVTKKPVTKKKLANGI